MRVDKHSHSQSQSHSHFPSQSQFSSSLHSMNVKCLSIFLINNFENLVLFFCAEKCGALNEVWDCTFDLP